MKERISCYIIDDEPLAREILVEYVSKIDFLELKGVFESAMASAEKIEEDIPDLLLLDINMPGIDGLSFIPMLNQKPMVILTTAYDQYALKAYELNVKDYLVKPISFEKFYKSVLRLYQDRTHRIQGEPKENVSPQVFQNSDFIFLKEGQRLQKVKVGDIKYIEGMKDYLGISVTDSRILTLMSFAEIEALLPEEKFARVHRSFIVAIEKIDHIERNRIKIGNKIIPISDSYKDRFFSKLKGGGL